MFVEFLGMQMSWMDAAISIFLIVMAVIGLLQGFVKKAFSLFGTLAVVIVSVLLAGTVGGWLMGPLGHVVSDPVAGWLAGIEESAETTVFSTVFDWTDAAVRAEQIPLVLMAMGLPATLSSLVRDTGIFNGMFEGFGNASLMEAFPNAVAKLAMSIIAFIILFIVLTILVAILKKILNRIVQFSILGWVNRLLGFALGLAHAYLIVSVLLTMISFIPIEGFLSAIYAQIDASTLTKFLVEHNWIGNWLIGMIF